MEVARHDSLADQLLELHALQEARIAADEAARAQAALEARRREEAEAKRRRQEEEEARRRAEEQALAEAEAEREAEERRALHAREAELRLKLHKEGQARATEIQDQLERESQAKIGAALGKLKARTRSATGAAVVILLVSAGAYGFHVRPKMERQSLEIARVQQEAQVLHEENAALKQKVEQLQRDLEGVKVEERELSPLPPAEKRPKSRPATTREPKRPRLEKPACDENDPLCGI